MQLEWGPAGAAALGRPDGVLVVVDVLSFTTAVAVAVGRGTAVHPVPRADAAAERLARRVGAVVAAGRREVTAQRPWSLSPAALASAPAPARLVLASPNGATIAAAAAGGHGTVVAACLRNAAAVAEWLAERLAERQRPVAVVPAGERWPDGSLRPALEDLLGAGALIAALCRRRRVRLDGEAAAARATYRAAGSVAEAVRRCRSGRELQEAGFGADVELAVADAAMAVVPVLRDGAFVAG